MSILFPTLPRTEPFLDGATAENPVNLLVCTNSLYLQHAGVCLTSLLANNVDLFFVVVVVGRTSEVLDEGKLRRSLQQFSNCSISFHKFTPPSNRIMPLNPRAHYTLDNWTRLWVEKWNNSRTAVRSVEAFLRPTPRS